jgi:hypothetical protein
MQAREGNRPAGALGLVRPAPRWGPVGGLHLRPRPHTEPVEANSQLARNFNSNDRRLAHVGPTDFLAKSL